MLHHPFGGEGCSCESGKVGALGWLEGDFEEKVNDYYIDIERGEVIYVEEWRMMILFVKVVQIS